MKQSRILSIIVSIILCVQLLTGIIVLALLYNESYHSILSLSVYFVTTFLIIVLFGIGFIIFFPTYQKTNRISRLNNIIYELLQQSVYIKEHEKFYQTILDSALQCIDQGRKGSIMLMDSGTRKLHFAAAVGYDMTILSQTYLELQQTYLYRESNGHINKTVKIHDPFEYDRKKIDERNVDQILEAGTDNVMTTLSTPIYYNGKLYGMINIDSPRVNAYDNYDIEVIELFAAEIANVVKLFKSMEENDYYMNYDQLTKLPNRKHINEIIHDIHQHSMRTGTTYSLVSIDLNNLKKTNDEFGHTVGDELLIKFATIFNALLPEVASIGRFGGDEFMLILPTYQKEDTEKLIQTISDKMKEQPIHHMNHFIDISFCYGIANFNQDSTELSILIRLSDQLMYTQKKAFHEIQSTHIQ